MCDIWIESEPFVKEQVAVIFPEKVAKRCSRAHRLIAAHLKFLGIECQCAETGKMLGDSVIEEIQKNLVIDINTSMILFRMLVQHLLQISLGRHGTTLYNGKQCSMSTWGRIAVMYAFVSLRTTFKKQRVLKIFSTSILFEMLKFSYADILYMCCISLSLNYREAIF